MFRGRNDIEIIERVREARATRPSEVAPHVPEELDAIVMKGLARDAGQRWQSAGDMHEALMRFIAMSRPPYGTASLSQWMRVAFAQEMADERAHLERLMTIAQPGVSVAHDSPALEQPSEPSAVYEELSQIVVVEELSLSGIEVSAPRLSIDIEPSVAAPLAPAPIAPITQVPTAQPPVPIAAPPIAAPHLQPQQTPIVPHASSSAPTTPSPRLTPSGSIAAPRVSRDAFATRVSSTPPPTKRGRGVLIALFVLAVLALGGGGAVWFFLLRGRALLAS